MSSFRKGKGPTIPLPYGPAEPVAAAIGVPWDRIPQEGASPFRWSQTEALELLGRDLTFLQWTLEHPDPLLVAARYGDYENPEEGQEEILWKFAWADGADILVVSCHRLITALQAADARVTNVSQDECFYHRERTASKPFARADYPADSITWAQAAERWREAAGSDLPIHHAQWTLASSFMDIGFSDGVDWSPGSVPVMLLDYTRGVLATDSPSPPTWLIDTPSVNTFSWSNQTIMNAETGDFYVLTYPADKDG